MVRPALRRASGYSIGPGLPGPPDPSIGPVDLPVPPAGQAGTVATDGTVAVELGDGTVILAGTTSGATRALDDSEFDQNLAEEMESGQLSGLAMELLDGIDSDILSRESMVADYTKGIDQLALTADEKGQGRQRKRTSTVRHPVMLDATVKFWAAAQAELLPASGPCKVRDDAMSTEARDEIAQAFERDMNHYLTVTAKEFYPDTAQMLMLLGFGGTAFKKVYTCPLRERPVSETVRLPDLIVSENATDLDNANRVTHKLEMTPVNVRRLQIGGHYRDIELAPPSPKTDQTRIKEQRIHGLAPAMSSRPQDQDRTLYECYTDLDLAIYGLAEPDAPKRLPLPYRVTLDKDSQQILEIRRNWREHDDKYRKRQRFVRYLMVPGFGFLGLGFLHLLRNQTKALTALWRIMIDCGMFGAFPGGVRIKGTRQTTNEIAPGPGEWPEIDTGPADDIRKALMPLPYKDLNGVLIQLAEMISAHAEKLGTSIEFPTGEGRTNIPVGTIMAMIEQQTQVMAAVHKGLHRSQQEELLLLKELMIEDPGVIKRTSRDPATRAWDNADDFADQNLVPATDPNVPSQIHRIMVATALVTLATSNPDIYDKRAVHKRALRTIGIADVDAMMPPPQPQQGPSPDVALQQKELELKERELGLKEVEQQRKSAAAGVETNLRAAELAQRERLESADRLSKERVAATTQETERLRLAHDHTDAKADRRQKDIHHVQALAAQAQQRKFAPDTV